MAVICPAAGCPLCSDILRILTKLTDLPLFLSFRGNVLPLVQVCFLIFLFYLLNYLLLHYLNVLLPKINLRFPLFSRILLCIICLCVLVLPFAAVTLQYPSEGSIKFISLHYFYYIEVQIKQCKKSVWPFNISWPCLSTPPATVSRSWTPIGT